MALAARRWSTPVALGLALVGAAAVAAAVIVNFGSAGWGYDFRAYYDAAVRLATSGTPYQAATLGGPFRPGPGGLYLYSPLPALTLVPLIALGPSAATALWESLHVALLVLTCALLPVSRNVRLATFGVAALSQPVLIDLNLGNVSLLVTFMSVVLWRWLDRPAGSAALAVSLAIRPTMALFMPWGLVRGRWRPAFWSVVVGAALIVASLPFVAVRGWTDYLVVVRNISDVTGVFNNDDLGSAALQLGASPALAAVALFAGYVIAGVAVLVSLRRDRELSFVVTLMAALLLSPLMWNHYLTQLVVPAAFLASRGRLWGLALPVLAWLPGPFLPLVALAGLLAPLVAPDRAEAAGFLDGRISVRAPAT